MSFPTSAIQHQSLDLSKRSETECPSPDITYLPPPPSSSPRGFTNNEILNLYLFIHFRPFITTNLLKFIYFFISDNVISHISHPTSISGLE
ncbi:hypothetical protein TNIN_268621 [Trichonephila inaurata madagascariensis]|uniref:Uncharacterized protein n=1 Tax=Trichonephila inaurata madagascariensis TaxID=2747483 RepID=A0A8X6I7R1_9ARAC|nr:hypothetical protein TNIN_268621 [Trichonephila inaurata madagascariensis]